MLLNGNTGSALTRAWSAIKPFALFLRAYIRTVKLTRMVGDHSLISHFTRQHNVEPQYIRPYLGVATDYEGSC